MQVCNNICGIWEFMSICKKGMCARVCVCVCVCACMHACVRLDWLLGLSAPFLLEWENVKTLSSYTYPPFGEVRPHPKPLTEKFGYGTVTLFLCSKCALLGSSCQPEGKNCLPDDAVWRDKWSVIPFVNVCYAGEFYGRASRREHCCIVGCLVHSQAQDTEGRTRWLSDD